MNKKLRLKDQQLELKEETNQKLIDLDNQEEKIFLIR